MNLDHLRFFQTVAQCQHITNAAQQLHISQPSLSKAIGNVETFAGAPLFLREKNKIYLNECGTVFAEGLQEFFEIMDSARAAIASALAPETGVVRIATSVGSGVLNDFLIDLHTQHPGILISQNLTQERSMIQELLLDNADLAVSAHSLREYASQIVSTLLLEEEMLLLIPEHNPLSLKERVSIQELEQERLIFNSSGMNLRECLEDAIQATGSTPNIVMETSSPDLVGVLMEREDCLALIPTSANHRMNHRMAPLQKMNRRAVHIAGGFFKRKIYLNYLDGGLPSASARLIIEKLPPYFQLHYGDIETPSATE